MGGKEKGQLRLATGPEIAGVANFFVDGDSKSLAMGVVGLEIVQPLRRSFCDFKRVVGGVVPENILIFDQWAILQCHRIDIDSIRDANPGERFKKIEFNLRFRISSISSLFASGNDQTADEC